MKKYDNNILSNLMHWDVNKLHGWSLSKKVPIGGFKWVEKTSRFNKDFMKKNYNEDSNRGYFLEFKVQYPGELLKLYNYLPF